MGFAAIVELEVRARLRRGLTHFMFSMLILLYGGLALAAYALIAENMSLPMPSFAAASSGGPGPFSDVLTMIGASRAALLLFLLGIVQAAMVTLVAPALAGTALAGERERQTFDILATTLGPRRIVIGKLLATSVLMMVLVLASAPALALAALLGPISIGSFVSVALVVGAISVLFVAIGILCSAWTPNSFAAAALGYGIVWLMILLSGAALGIRLAGGGSIWLLISSLNPITAIAAVVGQSDPQLIQALPQEVSGPITDGIRLAGSSIRIPLWTLSVTESIVAAVIVALMSSRLLGPARTAHRALPRLAERRNRVME